MYFSGLATHAPQLRMLRTQAGGELYIAVGHEVSQTHCAQQPPAQHQLGQTILCLVVPPVAHNHNMQSGLQPHMSALWLAALLRGPLS